MHHGFMMSKYQNVARGGKTFTYQGWAGGGPDQNVGTCFVRTKPLLENLS